MNLYYVVRKNGNTNTVFLVHGYNLVKKGYVVAMYNAVTNKLVY